MARPRPKCIECKHHYLRPDLPKGSKPLRSDYLCNAVFDLVTGEQLAPKCMNTREAGGECGKIGELFEVDEKAFGGV